jgi:hypothetical protein
VYINTIPWWATAAISVLMIAVFLGCVLIWKRMPDPEKDERMSRDACVACAEAIDTN